MDELERVRSLRSEVAAASLEARERAHLAWSRESRDRSRVGIALGRLTVAMVAVSILAGLTIVWLREEANDAFEDSVTTVDVDALWPASPDGPVNFLLVGVDTRPPGDSVQGSRADTVALVTVDAEQATVVMIPRDLYLGDSKVSAIRAELGPDGLSHAVSEHLGFELHHYVEIDMQSLVDLVDRFGPVRLSAQTAMRDRLSGFAAVPGCQTFDGAAMLAYFRSRRLEWMSPTERGVWVQDPSADVSRMWRASMTAPLVFDQLIAGAFDSPASARDRIEELAGALTVDDQVRIDDVVGLLHALEQPGWESRIAQGRAGYQFLDVRASDGGFILRKRPDPDRLPIVDDLAPDTLLHHPLYVGREGARTTLRTCREDPLPDSVRDRVERATD